MNCEEGDSPRIKIPQGILEGFVLRSRKNQLYYGFYGIPYAKAERFELPKKWEPWNGVLSATKAKDRCIQVGKATKRFIGSETCHFLNVFTPAFQIQDPNDLKGLPATVPRERYPVIVFIHGGGYDSGGGDLYGSKFLVDANVILVTFNYRLGALGFANLGDGAGDFSNFGLHDQQMALQWVQQNIKYFAGDNLNVTIMGESAGAACVHYLTLSTACSGLFAKAIMQSGSALAPWAFNNAPVDKLKKLLKQLDIGFSHNKTEIVTKLRRMDARAIAAQRIDFETDKDDLPKIHFAPSIEPGPENEKKILTESPMKILCSGKIINEVPLILGVNDKEGLYRSLPILRDSIQLKALNEHWSQELPRHLMYRKDSISQPEDFARSVRKFYFDSRPIVCPESGDARDRLTNLISDRLFIYPARKTALLHRAHTRKPENKIFIYNFKYSGDYSFCNGFDVRETYGASHADELQYLMNQRIFYSKISPGSQADEMIEKMIWLWGNFAATGIPSYPGQSQAWMPIPLKQEVQEDTLKFFSIDVEDKMIDDPFTSRMEFWDSIPDISQTF